MNGAKRLNKVVENQDGHIEHDSEGIDYYEINFNIVIQLVIKLFKIIFNCATFFGPPCIYLHLVLWRYTIQFLNSHCMLNLKTRGDKNRNSIIKNHQEDS